MIMKKIICVVMFIMVIMSGCAKQEEEKMVQIPADEIIFIKNYVNWADGYQDSGWFVDGAGNAYKFDFSTGNYDVKEKESDEQFIDRLEAIMGQSEPFAVADMDVLRKIYSEGLKIDCNASYDEETAAFDAGQNNYIFRNPENGKLIICFATGDVERQLKDIHAKKIKKYVGKLFPE